MEYILLTLMIVLIIEVYYLGQKQGGRLFTPNRGKQLIFVDTSVLIDGRIVEVAKTGFVPGVLAVPRSVVGELQYLADNADSEKRSKARHGLDVIQELKQIERIDFMLFQDGSTAKEGVDERLLKLAKENNGTICTLDFNLNKVAVVEGISVLNINELAQMLRMAYLPGEHTVIELVQKGQDSHQSVGYLPDGTMVVVENSNQLIGKTVDVEIIRSIQTAAGKMMFAKLKGGSSASDSSKQHKKHELPQSPRKALVARKVFRGTGRKQVNSTKDEPNESAQKESRQATRSDRNSASQPTPLRTQKDTRRPFKADAQRGRRRPADKEDVLLELVNKQ